MICLFECERRNLFLKVENSRAHIVKYSGKSFECDAPTLNLILFEKVVANEKVYFFLL